MKPPQPPDPKPRTKRTESPETEALRAIRELRKLDERLFAAKRAYLKTSDDVKARREAISAGLSLEAVVIVEKLTEKDPEPKAVAQ